MPYVELADWVRQQYGFSEVPEIRLLRSLTNDVYAVTVPEGKYVLKIYGAGWRRAGEIQYEIGLLNHLDQGGLRVAKPIQGMGQEILKVLPAQLGRQLAVLYEYAAGEKPEPPFSNRLYFLFGEAIGKMHELSDDFKTDYPRKRIDLETLIDQPLQGIVPMLEDHRLAAKDLLSIAGRVKNTIQALGRHGLDWGPIHGDATLDNLHVIGNEAVILYDFDSGGPGWRASDLQGWAIGYPEYQERYTAFLNGYRTVRKISDQDMEASWYLTLAWDIWGMQVSLAYVVKQGWNRDAIRQYLTEQMDWIRYREKFLL